MESAHRTSLAVGLVGIREKKAIPSLRSFCEGRFEPWAKATFEENAWKSWEWYRLGVRALLSCRKIADLPLDEINSESASEFCDAWTLAKIAGHTSISVSSRYAHHGE